LNVATKRVLIVYYSYTQQTKLQLKQFIAGLESSGVEVVQERLEPITPYTYPFATNIRLASAMLMTFFQKRMTIKPVAESCFASWDCIVLAGPTWSYNPSGPVLDFLDRYGKDVCGGQLVVPFISCRAYWFLHYWTLKRRLSRYGATVEQPIVFTHPVKEPWRSLGLLLKLRGGEIARRRYSLLRRHYPKYGHSQEQRVEAMEQGKKLAERLLSNTSP
jgi:hypothetical protein